MSTKTKYPEIADIQHYREQVIKEINDTGNKTQYIEKNAEAFYALGLTMYSSVFSFDSAIYNGFSLSELDDRVSLHPEQIQVLERSKIIRKRFDDELISYLLKLKWWDWSPEKIFRNLEVLCSGDLEQIRNISEM